MKVYVGFHCYNTLIDVVETLEKVFDDEVKALLWVEDKEFNDKAETFQDEKIEWRYYLTMEVE